MTLTPWPMTIIEEAEHITEADGWCWCQPRKEDVLPFGSETVHRHFWDRPEYSEEAP
ncbi:MAG: hypothetical protein M3N43_04005 [Actinomycetota bacterium]|nr:hypothetical protein [Actinomycetota bacterium]